MYINISTRLGNRTLSSIQQICGTGLEGLCWLQSGIFSIIQENHMLVKCGNCGKKFEKRPTEINRSKNHYCSRSCSVTMNNKARNKKTKKCKICGALVLSSRQKCPDCIKNHLPPDYTLREAIYEQQHKSSAFALVRSRARTIAKKANLNKCQKCGYDKHVEIAHIKPISSFSLETKLSEINHLDNLLSLCPNCHWEFDHQ